MLANSVATNETDHLLEMTKDDWIKLAMPASITLLAIAVLAAPVMVSANFPSSISVYQGDYSWRIRD